LSNADVLHHGKTGSPAVALAFLLCPAWLAAAPEVIPGNISVAQAWSRPTPPVATQGAAYLTIRNSGVKPDRLLSVATPIAGSAEVNETRSLNGVVQMRALPSLIISPGQTLRLEPGALHIMLLNLVHPLTAGTVYPLTLNFRNAGAVTVQVEVRDPP
jgi:periplasmic copper chaperone A